MQNTYRFFLVTVPNDPYKTVFNHVLAKSLPIFRLTFSMGNCAYSALVLREVIFADFRNSDLQSQY